MNRAYAFATAASLLFVASFAQGGDSAAHTHAMQTTATKVKANPEFKDGVGAPKVNGVTKPGIFVIPDDGSLNCSIRDKDCALKGSTGRGINAPDFWKCIDDDAPSLMNATNANTAPFQANLANLLSDSFPEVAMVCNWNHFQSNPSLKLSQNNGSEQAFDLVMRDAKEALELTRTVGPPYACIQVRFEGYYERVLNALHYKQDAACEHHAVGNEVCGNTDLIPVFTPSGIVDFEGTVACSEYLLKTLKSAVGNEPTTWCDEAVVIGPRTNVALNPNMEQVANLCGGKALQELSSSAEAALGAKLPLACAGLERTLRHHCKPQEVQKSLFCQGPAGDHSETPVNDGTGFKGYCEGEIHSGGGQDFIAGASGASQAVLEQAMRDWAEVCKQPDDPCEDTQCANWCKRTFVNGVYDNTGKKFDGFCINSKPDEACVLHECKCAGADECGEIGQPCCNGTRGCHADYECEGSTNICKVRDNSTCARKYKVEIISVPPEVPTDTTMGITARIVEKLPEGSKVTWSWSLEGVGSITTPRADELAPSNTARFVSGSGEGQATFVASARVFTTGQGTSRSLPVNASTFVKKGLREISFDAGGGSFACSDTKACGVSEYGAFIVPIFPNAVGYHAVLSGFGYPACNRTLDWTSTKGDGGDCNFPITYHPHSSKGPSDAWAVWTSFGGAPEGKARITVTLKP